MTHSGDNTRLISSKRRFGWFGEAKGSLRWRRASGFLVRRCTTGLKAHAAGRLLDVFGKTISSEQMQIARLKAELATTRTERDILKKAAAYFARESR